MYFYIRLFTFYGLLLMTPMLFASPVLGGYTAGCIPEAQALALDGTGYHVIRPQRQRFYGHPDLIKYIRQLGMTMQQKQLGRLLIADMAQRQGGPMPSGHRSHQIGLDADILFQQWLKPEAPEPQTRRQLHPVSMLTDDKQSVSSAWQARHAQMLKLAAQAEPVQRIFTHAQIKQALCQRYPGEAWLRKIRPWWGHEGHFHVRLRCPDDSPECKGQNEVVAGTGCGQVLQAWLQPPPQTKKDRQRKHPPKARLKLPQACRQLGL